MKKEIAALPRGYLFSFVSESCFPAVFESNEIERSEIDISRNGGEK